MSKKSPLKLLDELSEAYVTFNLERCKLVSVEKCFQKHLNEINNFIYEIGIQSAENMKYVRFSEQSKEPYIVTISKADFEGLINDKIAIDLAAGRGRETINGCLCFLVAHILHSRTEVGSILIPKEWLSSVAHFKKEYAKLFKTLSEKEAERNKEQIQNQAMRKQDEEYKQYIALKKKFEK